MRAYSRADDHQAQGHQDARQVAAHEQGRDRNTAAGHRVNDQDVAGRDQQAGGGSRRRQSRIELPWIAVLLHRWHHETADGRGGRYGRAGNGPEQGAGNDVDECQSARQHAHHRLGKIDQAVRDTALPHQLPGQYEQRNRQQGKAVEAAGHTLRHRGERR